MYRSVRVKLDPTPRQVQRLLSHCGAARFAYNTIRDRIKEQLDNKEKISLSYYDQRKYWNSIKHEIAIWYKENSKESYNHGIESCCKAFKNYFDSKNGKRKGKKVGFPKRKKKRDKKSFSYSTFNKIEDNRVMLPRIGWVHCFENVEKRINGAHITRATISQDNSGCWHISIRIRIDDVPIKEDKSAPIGIDVGIKELAVLSDGVVYDNPKNYKKHLKKIKKRHKQFSRKKNCSKRKEKARIKLAKIYKKMVNQRDDYLHKISREIVDEYSEIYVEDLSIQNMLKNHNLAQSIQDASWGRLLWMLEYKCEQEGKIFRRINPKNTSKTCSCCGHVKTKLGLDERVYICENCGAEIDRDLNAAINILFAGSAPENSNAHGEDVRLLEQSFMKCESGCESVNPEALASNSEIIDNAKRCC